MPTVSIGTRGSQLALWQANRVATGLRTLHPGLDVAVQVIRTKGDHIQDVPLARIGGKGLFVKEIEEALLDGRADIAVHSLKDVPDTLPPGLILAAFLPREVPYDAFVSDRFERLESLPRGARVGTSSLRRAAQVLASRPDLHIVPLRGNVDTRLRRLQEGLDAIILAAAGLHRLGLGDRVRELLVPPDFIPAVGQGVIVVECREQDAHSRSLLAALDDAQTRVQVRAERAFLRAIGGGCQVPLGAYARVEGVCVSVIGMIARPDGSLVLKDASSSPIEEADRAGEDLARRLLERGGREVLREIEEHPPWGR